MNFEIMVELYAVLRLNVVGSKTKGFHMLNVMFAIKLDRH